MVLGGLGRRGDGKDGEEKIGELDEGWFPEDLMELEWLFGMVNECGDEGFLVFVQLDDMQMEKKSDRIHQINPSSTLSNYGVCRKNGSHHPLSQQAPQL
ncbi:hypothetical protein V6N12_068500 [Hibiscus sabdariffa]|uniref:Uncharacterized protein n=1 Tax=Hibiscus sabdariffa TaxID=183260 RepID=A0ABR2FQW3_9ROSI